MENSRNVKIITGLSKEIFQTEIYPQRKPVILRGVDIGDCKEKWTKEYLAENGGSVEVKIHVSKTHQMDFIHKNFLYRSLPFNELLRRASEEKHTEYFIDENEKYYLRALGTGDPRKDIADIRNDFPNLAKDIVIPELFDASQFFSSVLRVASKSMQLWTHYDVTRFFI
ncbi:hypothetical protein LOTGIDRAFT_172630 [Lottia gigantea]|uniref:Cupin-like domain-containing protein n=1 Tax=Lottia gigantea TaxID=225164 RepID=V4B620_LOTGI|nr:hypothetical protein LOTGIDRAFT_172630 [Lottia gigantea]ESP01532.1 hypothetical protein LOTGIDRAFT_172630 [Lottia gigantea]